MVGGQMVEQEQSMAEGEMFIEQNFGKFEIKRMEGGGRSGVSASYI